ncbi:MATE family efflux transporter [Cupriavidus sp. SK-3]|uniref:MATE family efflux transporter n=1 Tax=Cupriavidus sp. SK-3 TaxID=1470558 RepID=UPI000B2E44EE|nr:MATE family efflux transporter [Cupriavidus sp. SK-3]
MNESLLTGPITPRLLRMAWPILVVLAVQTLVGVAETYFVGFLGTDAITGVALVFPLLMLMTMMSNGGLGGGVSSAIARAMGAGRRNDADALVWHAVVVAIAFGALFTAAAALGGPALYRALGGKGPALAAALEYSNLVFGAAIPIWIANLLASALRGAGNVKVPATLTAVGAALTLALSPPLILGWGPIPRLGIAGAGYAMIVYYLVATIAFVIFMLTPRSPVRLRIVRIEWRLMKAILGVGLLSAVGTLLTNATVVVCTGLVGKFGVSAIAGYGMASRLDYLLIPLLFAVGTATVTMVGVNVGAGKIERARHIAWTAATLSAAVTGLIGIAAALVPELWMGLFSNDAQVIEAGASYLRRAGPMYVFFGLGMSLYFASQGAGKVLWPVVASLTRLLVATLGGWYLLAEANGAVTELYWVMAGTLGIFGAINAIAFAKGDPFGQKKSELARHLTRRADANSNPVSPLSVR